MTRCPRERARPRYIRVVPALQALSHFPTLAEEPRAPGLTDARQPNVLSDSRVVSKRGLVGPLSLSLGLEEGIANGKRASFNCNTSCNCIRRPHSFHAPPISREKPALSNLARPSGLFLSRRGYHASEVARDYVFRRPEKELLLCVEVFLSFEFAKHEASDTPESLVKKSSLLDITRSPCLSQ